VEASVLPCLIYTTFLILDQFFEFLVVFGVAARRAGSSLPGWRDAETRCF
jgi:hypothetical protein